LFEHATTPLATATATGQSTGWTLHQLRHSTLTHDAESGTNTPMLLARSGTKLVRRSGEGSSATHA